MPLYPMGHIGNTDGPSGLRGLVAEFEACTLVIALDMDGSSNLPRDVTSTLLFS